VDWYRGERKRLWIFSRTALWYTPGLAPVAIRFVLVRDPQGKLSDAAFFCTNLHALPEQILHWVVMRWSVEVTFEEARAHLGVETQRQWSDLAIARTTPVLLLSGVGFLRGKEHLRISSLCVRLSSLWPRLWDEATQRKAALIAERHQNGDPSLPKDTDQA
jgi:hypothetical protein